MGLFMHTRSNSPASLVVHDGGVTSIEYALIVGLIALTIIGAASDVGGALTAFFASLSEGLAL